MRRTWRRLPPDFRMSSSRWSKYRSNASPPAFLAAMGRLGTNYTVRGSYAAASGLGNNRYDALMFHTQSITLFAGRLMRKTPSVISIDATPAQLAGLPGYPPVPGWLRRVREHIMKSALRDCKGVVSFSHWARRDAIDRYGADPSKVVVIPSAIDCEKWRFDRRLNKSAAVRFLFVGTDFERKGGLVLLNAFKTVRASLPDATLDIVTPDPVPEGHVGVTIYNNLKPNTDALMERYSAANVFVFPTRGDCMPWAVLEALAAGLPVISTNVGAILEAVVPDRTGIVVPADHADATSDAMLRLAKDDELRFAMGQNARDLALELYNANDNYGRLYEYIEQMAG